MIEDPILIHSQLVGLGKNNKNSKIKIIRGLIVAPKRQTVLAVVQTQYSTYTHTAHCAGSSANTHVYNNRTNKLISHCASSSGDTIWNTLGTRGWQ